MSIFGSISANSNYPGVGTIETVAPTTGQTVTITAGTSAYIINPAGTLLALTVTMPASPTDGQLVWISSSQIITGLTLNANSGQTILNVPTTLALGGFCGFMWINSLTKWFRIS